MTNSLTASEDAYQADRARCWAPLEAYASRHQVDPGDFMFMGTYEGRADGAPVALHSYKHYASRNYLCLDQHGLSAWTSPDPYANLAPITAARAIEHATSFDHKCADGCLRNVQR